MKFRVRTARVIFIVLQVVASAVSLIVIIPWMIALFALWVVPGWDYTPSELFHSLRRFFFRVFAGRTLRPFTLRASLPSGTSIRASSDTRI